MEREQFRAAFEEEEVACSKGLVMGEQDSLVNLYRIEKAAHSAKCSTYSHKETKRVVAGPPLVH
jgi:hypothetical protein